MERAGRVIARWKTSGDSVTPEKLARAAWRAAIGERIAAHTTGVSLEGKNLIVQVEDEVWRHQLSTLRPEILHRLTEVLGEGIVSRLVFQVKERRIGPGREGLQRKAVGRDEADQIEDPVLRVVYKQSRKRSSA